MNVQYCTLIVPTSNVQRNRKQPWNFKIRYSIEIEYKFNWYQRKRKSIDDNEEGLREKVQEGC